MNFDEAVEYLLKLGHETLTIKLGLRNTELLLEALQNPQQSYPSVQVAGTNGKGSTSVFLDSICRQAGFKVGLYTSPHLHSLTERIKIAGSEISRSDFARIATAVRDAAGDLLSSGKIEALPTFFEHVTAIALVAFRQAGVERAILETGLGGRLDATTAARAGICAITQIGYDHEEYLGTTLQSIAAEKAAIIHPGSTAVIAPQLREVRTVILDQCRRAGVTPLIDGCTAIVESVTEDGRATVTFETTRQRYEHVSLGLRGRHQVENAGVAIQLAEVLETETKAVIAGLQTASHPGRLELIGRNPTFLLDGAHNPAGAAALRNFLAEFAKGPIKIIFGAMRDKHIDEIGGLLFPLADELVLTAIDNPRAASLETLMGVARKFTDVPVTTTATSHEALKIATQKTAIGGTVCITGSLYLIGEIRYQLLEMFN